MFTVGDVDITLTEPSWEALEKNPQAKVIAPNKSIAKDPTVTVKGGSEECYVRLLVTVENIEAFKAAFQDDVAADGTFLLENFVTDWDPTEWVFKTCTYEGEGEAKAAIYEFRYKTAVVKSESDTPLTPLFTNIHIPGTATNDDLAKLPAEPTINVVAQAIQTQGFGDDVDAAWRAFNVDEVPAQQ